MVIELTDVRKAYGDLVVFDHLTMHIERGDRIALVAPNGAGKSTLMRMLSGAEAPGAGTYRAGHQVVMQYFAQDEAARLDPVKTVYQTLEAEAPIAMVPMIRNLLGGFLFAGDDIYKKAGVLSGGERTRLAVARMLLKPANTLLLDEPTNHLDAVSTAWLEDALQQSTAAVVMVTHDRYFLERVARRIVELDRGELHTYDGGYHDFLVQRAQDPAISLHHACRGQCHATEAIAVQGIHSGLDESELGPTPFQGFVEKFVSRIVLLPLIAGVSYEVIRFAAKQRTGILSTLTAPGLWLQRITTQPPSDEQTAVAIHALEGAMALESPPGNSRGAHKPNWRKKRWPFDRDNSKIS